MNEQQLWLDPDRAQRGGTDLALAGKAMTDHRNGLGAEIAAASGGRPWGRDDIGAEVENGYRGLEASILKAWAGIGDYLQALGIGAVQAVNASVETDAASAGRVGRTVV